jgi:hypothetical protein
MSASAIVAAIGTMRMLLRRGTMPRSLLTPCGQQFLQDPSGVIAFEGTQQEVVFSTASVDRQTLHNCYTPLALLAERT